MDLIIWRKDWLNQNFSCRNCPLFLAAGQCPPKYLLHFSQSILDNKFVFSFLPWTILSPRCLVPCIFLLVSSGSRRSNPAYLQILELVLLRARRPWWPYSVVSVPLVYAPYRCYRQRILPHWFYQNNASKDVLLNLRHPKVWSCGHDRWFVLRSGQRLEQSPCIRCLSSGIEWYFYLRYRGLGTTPSCQERLLPTKINPSKPPSSFLGHLCYSPL